MVRNNRCERRPPQTGVLNPELVPGFHTKAGVGALTASLTSPCIWHDRLSMSLLVGHAGYTWGRVSRLAMHALPVPNSIHGTCYIRTRTALRA